MSEVSASVKTEKLSLKEKISYGLGDCSMNILMGFTMMFLTIYYTDVFKLNPAVMGTLFLVARIVDAITDPMCGVISDRTRNRLGRYRCYLLYFAVPYGVACAAIFWTPDLGETGKVIYAYVTYIMLIICYSFVCVPYVSLLGAISNDSAERLSINTIRFPLTKVAYIICSLVVPGCVALFDNEILGYRYVMCAIGVFCIILVLICFFNTKERVHEVTENNVSLGTQFKLLFKNDQALCMFAGQALVMVSNTLKFGAAAYFVKYVIESDTSILSAFLTAGSVAGIIAPFISNYLLQNGYIKRSNLLCTSQIAGGIFLLLIGLIASDSVILNVGLFFLSLLCGELIAIMVWSSVADCGDYTYFQHKVRITGIISGGMMFSTKLGMAIGGALLGYVLAFYDYNPDTATSASSDQLFAFVLLFAYLPAAVMIIAGLVFKHYKLETDFCEQFKENK